MHELLPIIRRVRRPLMIQGKAESGKAESGSKVAAIEVPSAKVSGASILQTEPLLAGDVSGATPDTTAGTAVPPIVPTKKSRAKTGSN